MIQIRYVETGDSRSLLVEGHAGYAPAGQDIVCAAVSVLTCTLAQCLQEIERKGHIRLDTLAMLPGNTDIQWTVIGDKQESHGLLHVIWTGYALLARTYPNHVTVSPNITD